MARFLGQTDFGGGGRLLAEVLGCAHTDQLT